MITFNSTHGSLTSPKHHGDNPITSNNFLELNIRFMGGGVSQNILSFYILEHLIQTAKPQYIVEIGSQKGALSLFLANMAGVTEQFLFHTYEIDKSTDWYSREREGVGHWFEKIAKDSNLIHSFEANCFDPKTIEQIKKHISQYKTLIICDGGSKITEHNTYGPLLKSGDIMMLHDFPVEINDEDINWNIFKRYEPFCTAFEKYHTRFKSFIKI